MTRTRWLPEAKQELLDVVRWYENEQSGLGGQFLDELERQLERIRKSPLDFPKWEFSARRYDVRRAELGRFPQRILFVVNPSETWIAAISHPSRAPKYWIKRLQQIRIARESE